MTTNTKQEFTQEAQRILRSLADLPWGRGAFGEVRVLRPGLHDPICPLCMYANRQEGAWRHGLDALEAMRAIGWPISKDEMHCVMNAADNPQNEMHGELVRLLGGVLGSTPVVAR